MPESPPSPVPRCRIVRAAPSRLHHLPANCVFTKKTPHRIGMVHNLTCDIWGEEKYIPQTLCSCVALCHEIELFSRSLRNAGGASSSFFARTSYNLVRSVPSITLLTRGCWPSPSAVTTLPYFCLDLFYYSLLSFVFLS